LQSLSPNQSATRPAPAEPTGAALISIVIPVFDEEPGIGEFHRQLSMVMNALPYRWEALYVNDGSRDASLLQLQRLREADAHVGILNLSRNFGKEIAMTAGLDHACGDAVVVIDADLQDPPELIPELIAAWHEGFDMVYAQRRERAGETWLKKTTAAMFYRLMSRVAPGELPNNTGDFRLMTRRAVEAVTSLRERHRFMKGVFAWVGYRSRAVPYDRAPRSAGRSKWSYWKLWNLALEGITSFTVLPLKIATYLGLLVALFAFAYGTFIVGLTVVYGNPVAGYPSLLAVILFLGGIQLMTLGVIGEHLGRIFNETKQRPLYLVDQFMPAEEPDPDEERRGQPGAFVSPSAARGG
jgi:glycosyltransferase involved in cell wall biosynthesis